MKVSRKLLQTALCFLTVFSLVLATSCQSKKSIPTAAKIVEILVANGADFDDMITISAQTGAFGYDENSLLSAKSGIKIGVNAIEADLAFLPDGTPVLAKSFHDADEKSVPLKNLLAELENHPNVRLYLYLRELSDIPKLTKMVGDYHLGDRISYLGITPTMFEFTKLSNELFPYYCTIDITDEVLKSDEKLYALAEDFLGNGASGFVFDASKLTKEIVDRLKTMFGLEIIAYGANTNEDLANMISWGVDGVITKYPEVLMDVFTLWNDTIKETSLKK